jgi:hypothetical protein
VNGGFRELVMIEYLKIAPHPANQISCLTGVALWTLLLLLVWRKLEVKKFRDAAFIGMGWLFATIVFETFILNHKLTWPQILHTYDVSSGEYWGLVVLWIGLLPLIAYALSHVANKSDIFKIV